MLWFWGLAGAFIYAAPRLSASVFQARQEPKGAVYWFCVMEFVIAIVVGAIAAAAFAPYVAAKLGGGDEHKLRAISAMLGLISNRLAPLLVDVVNGRVLKFLKEEKA